MTENTEKSTRTQSMIPNLTVRDAARAIEFYKNAFKAKELTRMLWPSGKGIMHAELQIGDSIIFLNDEFPEMGAKSPQTLGGTTGSIYLTVDDVDSVFSSAVEAGAQVQMAVANTFWGDRMGSLIDPFGHHWAIASHTEDLSPEERQKRTDKFYSQMTPPKE